MTPLRLDDDQTFPPVDLRPFAINMVRIVNGRIVTMTGEDIEAVLAAMRRAREAEEATDNDDEENQYLWW